jgi:hypothetical protein
LWRFRALSRGAQVFEAPGDELGQL